MLEKDIVLSCQKRLMNWQSRGVVVWFDRSNSGKIQSNGRWIQLHKPGTPDLTAYINYNGSCFIYFIEVKTLTGRQSDKQLEFMMKFRKLTNVFYQLVNDPEQIDITIEKITGYTDTKLKSFKI